MLFYECKNLRAFLLFGVLDCWTYFHISLTTLLLYYGTKNEKLLVIIERQTIDATYDATIPFLLGYCYSSADNTRNNLIEAD